MRTFTVSTSQNLSTRIEADDLFVEDNGTLVLYNAEVNGLKEFVASHKVAAFADGQWTRVVADAK